MKPAVAKRCVRAADQGRLTDRHTPALVEILVGPCAAKAIPSLRLGSPDEAHDVYLSLCLAIVAFHEVAHHLGIPLRDWTRRAWGTTPGGRALEADARLQRCGLTSILAGAQACWAGIDESRLGEASTLVLRAVDGLKAAPSLPSELVQRLVPPARRRRRGEFYTPEWLVEHVLDIVGWPLFRSEESARLVDPMCGGGAFLVGAIRRLRASREIGVEGLLSSVQGYDVSPVAVLAARVACLLALLDLLPADVPFHLPVSQRDIARAIPSGADAGKAAFVVGNPPWIRWSELDDEARELVGKAAHRYGLVPRSYHGGNQIDVAAVMSFLTSEIDLALGGKSCLVLPSTLLRSPASTRFRRMRLPDGIPLGLAWIVDFGGARVFREASNRTVVMCWQKGKESSWPVRGLRWESVSRDVRAPHRKRESAQLEGRCGWVEPVGEQSRWVWMERGEAARLGGQSEWARGRKGITTDLNGAYFVRVLGEGATETQVEVINDVTTRGHRVPVHRFEVEKELLYPLLKGAAQIRPFTAECDEKAVIVPNRSIRRGQADEATFARKYPGAHAHFRWIEEQTKGALSRRSTYLRRLSGFPFYFIYNVGEYTFSPYKVVWAEIASSFCAAVVGTEPLAGQNGRTVVPDHKVYFAPFENEDTAYYLCGLLNSTRVRRFIDRVTTRLQIGTVLGQVRIPSYNPTDPIHRKMAHTSQRAKSGTGRHTARQVDNLAEQIIKFS